MPDKNCPYCDKCFNRRRLKGGRLEDIGDYRARKFCSKKCYNNYHVGSRHHNFKNGTKKTNHGYLRDSRTDRYIHRLAMEKHLGRRLKTSEHVHHLDGDKTNNSISNLELVTNSGHRKIHCKNAKRDRFGRFAG